MSLLALNRLLSSLKSSSSLEVIVDYSYLLGVLVLRKNTVICVSHLW